MNNTAVLSNTRFTFRSYRTYLAALAFIAGNVIVPQLCHLIPRGGLIFLPIYFFTLVASFRCGWKAGLLTAVLSPLVNCAFFGMPPVAALPAILIKSVSLVFLAELLSRKMGFSLLSVALAVVGYQLIGSVFEFFLDFNLAHALQDIRIGWPGILIQIVLGYLAVKLLFRWKQS